MNIINYSCVSGIRSYCVTSDSDDNMAEKKTFERLPKCIVPSNYNVTLTPDLEAFTFKGKETISIEVKWLHVYLRFRSMKTTRDMPSDIE